MKSGDSKSIRRVNRSIIYGFTIVELLVVIVVIGVLAAITIASYTGVTQKAVASALQSDLVKAKTQLNMFQVDNSAYPATISTDCDVSPTSTIDPTNLCLKASSNNNFSNYIPSNSSNPQTFSLTIGNPSLSYSYIVTNNSKPASLAPAPLSPVADWLALPQGDHYGNFYDLVTKVSAAVSRNTPKTIYDPTTQKIYDVPVNKLGIRPRSDGKSGFEAEVEEARTNYLTNSSLEVDTDSNGMADGIGGPWGPGITSYTKQLVSGNPTYGNKYQQFTNITASSSTVFQIYTGQVSGFTAGESATCSAFVSGNSSGTVFHIRTRAYQDNTTLGEVGPTYTLSDKFTRVEAAYTSLPPNTNKVMCLYQLSSVDPGDSPVMNIDSTQLEKGAFATSYIPTTTISVSRLTDIVTIPNNNIPRDTGTIHIVLNKSKANTTRYSLVYWQSPGYIGPFFSGSVFGFQHMDGSSSVYSTQHSAGDSLGSGLFVHSVVYNAGNNSSSYINGSIKTTLGPTIASSAKGTINLGGNGTLSYCSGIQRYVFYSVAQDDGLILQVSDSIKDGP